MNPEDCLQVLKLFLQNGQNVNAIGGYGGQSILIKFVAYKHTQAVKYLLDNTAIDLNIKLTEARKGVDTALEIAKRENMKEIVAMLEKVTVALNCVQNYSKIVR